MKKLKAYAITLCLLLTFLSTDHLLVEAQTPTDYWVINPVTTEAQIDTSTTGIIKLSNGLIERTINTTSSIGGVTTSFRNLYKNWELLDHPEQESIIGIDGTLYNVGGTGSASQLFEYSHYTTGNIEAEFNWTPKPYTAVVNPWPALGKQITLVYTPSSQMPAQYQNLLVEVKYEIYQGIPVIGKRTTVYNNGTTDIKITYYANDVLAVKSTHKDKLYAETSYNGGSDLNRFRNLSVNWQDQGTTSILKTQFDMGPNQTVEAGKFFDGFKTYELLHSVDYYEWKQIEIQEMYRIVTPWINESPIFLHLISDNSTEIRNAVDACKAVGFDLIIQSFGSGINLESTNQSYINRVKSDYDYAHSQGLEIGGYTLACIKDYNPVNGPEAINGDYSNIARCLATEWSVDYWNNIKNFLTQTGSDFIEIDGPYHFYTCTGGPTHLHDGYDNSRYAQWKASTVDMFKWLKENDIYINAPDWMYLSGSNKSGIGYEEIGWSQPRQEQLVIGRMYNYKGTFLKAPTMGWTFLPLDQYHGGGSAATFEPLSENIKDYEWAVAQNFFAGVQPFFRGKRPYDTEKTKNILKYWVDFYKRYQKTLTANTIHVKPPKQDPNNPQRATEMDIIMHANSQANEKAMVMVFNQTDQVRTETFNIPLYYSGLTNLSEPPVPAPNSDYTDINLPAYGQWPPPYPTLPAPAPYVYPAASSTNKSATFYQEGKTNQTYTIDSNGNVQLTVTLEPMSYTWYSIYDPTYTPEAPIPYPTATAIAKWEFEDNSLDTSGNANNGTVNGGITYVTDAKQGSKAIKLDGNASYMRANTVTNATNNITMSGWVKQETGGSTQIIMHNGDTSYNGYGLLVTANQSLKILCGSVSSLDVNSTLPLNQWTHVAMVREQGLWKFYLNGQPRTVTNASIAPKAPSSVGTYLGANNKGTENFKGILDDMRIYEEPLDMDMIQKIMN